MLTCKLRTLPVILAAALLAGCWKDDDRLAGGDATETGNAIAGRITLDGKDAAGARVSLLPSDYNPVSGAALPDSLTRTLDENGAFKFKGLKAGQYNIEGRHAATGARLLIVGVTPRADKQVDVVDSLRPTGSLYIPLPESRDTGAGFVYVPGSTFQVRVDAQMRRAGRVLLDSLPAGVIPTLVYTKGDSTSPQIPLASDVVVAHGVTSQIPPFFWWAHSAKLIMNTSAAGVPITAPLRDFPLLVRLAAPSFDFSQALGDGGDLRFSDGSGKVLPYEIESWDSAAGHAEIWVRVDSIAAGSASQSVTMHWGSSQAVSPGSYPPVFDTGAGFACVWHLNQEAADTTANGIYRDATQGGSNGNDRVKSTDRGGAIGYGHGLISGDYVQAAPASEKLRLTNAFTISTWFKTTAAPGDSGGELLSVGDNYGLRMPRTGYLHMWFWPPSATAGANSGWYSADTKGVNYMDGAWHLATGVFDGANLRLYADGQEMVVKAAPTPVDYKYPLNVTVGKHGFGKPGFEFTGNLDEVEVHSAARSADWIRLMYENQRPGSTFPVRVAQ